MRTAVVKLGGSTANSAELAIWVAALAASTLPLVLVPGGGPFADHVRDEQERMGFSDRAAHPMAILAMEQFGWLLLDRSERLAPARSMAEIEQALEYGHIPVWLPSSMALAATDIPVSWNVTSDALAAWLARRTDADALLLVKQTDAFGPADTIDSLTRAGIVDAAFASMLPANVDFHLAGPRDAAMAHAMLASGRLPGLTMRRMQKTV